MSMKTDHSGRRSVELAFEVPGTPEDVWQAIATGPGISSWLFPAEVDERVGGAVAFHIGPGVESSGTVTVWEPPHRFAYQEPDWSPNAPPLGTEFIVETRSGGLCVVHVVHSLFADSDEWDDQIASFESGWSSYFNVLRLVLTHFRGLRASGLRAMGSGSGSETESWQALTEALGLAGVAAGQRRRTSGAPPLSGIVERLEEGRVHELILRTDAPAPGLVLLGAYNWGGQVHTSISGYLFGEGAPAVAAREEPLWRAWMEERFPPRRGAGQIA